MTFRIKNIHIFTVVMVYISIFGYLFYAKNLQTEKVAELSSQKRALSELSENFALVQGAHHKTLMGSFYRVTMLAPSQQLMGGELLSDIGVSNPYRLTRVSPLFPKLKELFSGFRTLAKEKLPLIKGLEAQSSLLSSDIEKQVAKIKSGQSERNINFLQVASSLGKLQNQVNLNFLSASLVMKNITYFMFLLKGLIFSSLTFWVLLLSFNFRRAEDGSVSMDSTKSKVALIVDDEESVWDTFEVLLDEVGYKCIFAKDGVAALDVLEGRDVDIIFSDIFMPNMGGDVLLQKLHERGINIPVILMSCDPKRPKSLEGEEAGKIFTKSELLTLLSAGSLQGIAA